MPRPCRCLLVASLVLLATPSRADPLHLEVSADGSGDFTTVQAAVDDVPAGSSDWTVIHIRAGHYFEALEIPTSKRKVILVGDGRAATVLEYDASIVDRLGRLVAIPVLTNRADDVVVRSLSLRNLAAEPGGSGGKWDAALMNFGDRLVLDDVFLRGDHDTLLMYGPAFNGGPGYGQVYVRDSHIQGRGDFIAAFTSAFIEDSVLETIRDPSHFLFHWGVPSQGPEGALVVKSSTFTGQSLDPVQPAGVTNLYAHAHVYLIENTFEYDLGANRPVAFFHNASQPFTAEVRHFGNTQAPSPLGPMSWDLYTIPGPPGTPRQDLPVTANEQGDPIVGALTAAEAAAITPAWLFMDWDPTHEEASSVCEDGIDNDGDGTADLADPGCASSVDFSELSPRLACDNGLDDDGDGWTDFVGGDPGCGDASGTLESPQCQDGKDNDRQLGIDFDGGATLNGGVPLASPDVECTGAWLNREAAPAPAPPPGCGIGIELVVLLPLLARRQREN
jgi:hypothetical protein